MVNHKVGMLDFCLYCYQNSLLSNSKSNEDLTIFFSFLNSDDPTIAKYEIRFHCCR
ncbi:unnamed protein product [Brugia timori]|uniref:Uncharacterized protein n=1 Tax=Brugia timori TaxID=42155 RepID=A0A3P7SVS7_9BILA|nr:unnamed protein product [Brugia timori]